MLKMILMTVFPGTPVPIAIVEFTYHILSSNKKGIQERSNTKQSKVFNRAAIQSKIDFEILTDRLDGGHLLDNTRTVSFLYTISLNIY